MNRCKGFSVLELLISMAILLMLLGGVCYSLLLLPKIAYHQYMNLNKYQKFADIVFAIERDCKSAGYGINNLFPLITFGSVNIDRNKDGVNSLECYFNNLNKVSKVMEKFSLLDKKVKISKIDGLEEGNYIIIAEVSVEPHWAIIEIKKIINGSNENVNIIFENILSNPVNRDGFDIGAYFVPIQKIGYRYIKGSRSIVRIINDRLHQLFIEDIGGVDFSFCDRDEIEMRDCLELMVYENNNDEREEKYSHIINLINLVGKRRGVYNANEF